MLTLWGRMTSVNVQKVAWVLAESNLEYKHIDAGGAFGGLDAPKYLAMNPNGRVPTLIDGTTAIWESNAICRHLVRAYGGPLALDAPVLTTQSDMWMDWFLAGPYTPFIEVFYQKVRLPKPQRDARTLSKALDKLHQHFEIAETALEGQNFLLGDELSLADIPFGACLYRYFTMTLDRPDWPQISRYYERLVSRASYRETVMTSYESLRAPD